MKTNPIASFLSYLMQIFRGRVRFPDDRFSEEVDIPSHGRFTVFRQIEMMDRAGTPKKAGAIFGVVFHSPSLAVDTVIRRTGLTMPFFAGQPGFCRKAFLVNREEKKFSGQYEWASVEAARNYSRSFAVDFMKKRSRPMPLTYWIIDKRTGLTVTSETI